jgi:flavin reductase (DIM6/NTAB) family NADH-FMN oxidoreductase RutF
MTKPSGRLLVIIQLSTTIGDATSMKHIDIAALDQLPRHYRANLINSLSGYKPANLIGTISEDGHTNLAIFSSVVHLGANPALLAMVQRPLTDYSHTYYNIKETGYYTINHVHKAFAHQAHFTSARFDRTDSEFDRCQLTATYLQGFLAPFVAESRIKIGMEFLEEVYIRHNDTRLIIGKVAHIFFPEEIIQTDGNLALDQCEDMCLSGLETWYTAAHFASYPYAKADQLPDFTSPEQTF